MKNVRRPSASLVISMLALFIAIGGSTYAATKINGKTLKNNSVAGKKLKKESVTGKQVKESSLGEVPSAANAANATNAGKAADADKVGGNTVLVRTATVTLPAFGAGQNQCHSIDVAVPDVQVGDLVALTPAANVTWAGNDQAVITAHDVPNAGEVNVQACLSADAAPPFTPTADTYKFLIVR